MEHASLILHHSRPAARLIPAPSHQHLSNREHGTRVNVQDLFGNMPVRVKQRALGSTNGEVEKEFENLKRQIVGLLLAWPLPVSISLKIAGSNKDLHIRGENARTKDDNVSLSRSLDLSLIRGILSQAGYIEPSHWADWIKTSARTPFITIRGAFSLQPAPTKLVQFIALGLHPIRAETGGNVLFDEVNRLVASSSFGNQEDIPNDEASEVRKQKDRRFKQDGFTNKQLKGGGKGVDKWPMFYICIEMQRVNSVCDKDVEGLGESTLAGLLKVLGAMVTGFLNENHFRPRNRHRTRKYTVCESAETPERNSTPPTLRNNDSASSSTKSRHRDDVFSPWTQIKSGIHVKSSAASPSLKPIVCENSLSKDSSRDPSSPFVEQALVSKALDVANTSNNEDGLHESDPTVTWTNPVSGATSLVNARTGQVINPSNPKRPVFASSTSSSMYSNRHSELGKRLTRAAPSADGTSKEVSWSTNLLKSWKNPVFDLTEEAIPQVSFEGPSLEISDVLHGRRHCCSDTDIQKAFKQSSTSLMARLSRQDLKNASVIAQVDEKFILISISDTSSPADFVGNRRQLLVLVDQHAADERIRVEGLLADLCSSSTPMAKPILLEISLRENELLTRHLHFFTSWGIVYDITATPESGKSRLAVKALPKAIAERCRTEPKVLINLLRGEAWKREELGLRSAVPESGASVDLENPSTVLETEAWLPRLSTIPQALLDMLNSRACRSAIMFNDVLSMDECTTLILRLAECAFPFQCAHGRPSMVPLVDVSGMVVVGDDAASSEENIGFGEAWRRWKPVEEEEEATSVG